ncbi:hypothetical protein FJR05_16370 [Dolichospermum sp. UHCC 0259]|nr:hypothetical protein [Dolichospermum sp. UHCC 0259]
MMAIVFVLLFPGLGQGILDFGFWILDFGFEILVENLKSHPNSPAYLSKISPVFLSILTFLPSAVKV